MNSSSSSRLDLRLETLYATLESQKRLLTGLIATIEKHKIALEVSLEVINLCRLKEKKK